MIFGRKKKERVEEPKQILSNQMKQFQIEQLKKEFENNLHKDYKEALQNLVTELVSEDLKDNAHSSLYSKDQHNIRN